MQHIAWAGSQTLITTDGSLPGTSAGNIAGVGGVYTVPGSAGLLVGGRNLFHSFAQFSVGSGDAVDFTGPGTVQNIISRVTGGDVSEINGEIRSSIDGANLYLMNPAGILFGPDSFLNVSGEFYATTADRIDFADGSRLSAAPGPTDSQLTVADPAAFGFLGPSASRIEVDGATLAVQDGKALTFVAAELDIHGDGTRGAALSAPAGTVRLFTKSDAGEIGITGSDLAPSSGHIAIAGVSGAGAQATPESSMIAVGGNGAGSVRIVSGSLTVTDARIVAENTGPAGTDAAIAIAADSVELTRSRIETATKTAGNGDAADIEIVASDRLSLLGDSAVVSVTGNAAGPDAAPGDAFGKGGDIVIAAGEAVMTGDGPDTRASITSLTTAAGEAGSIWIEADSLAMQFATIDASATQTGGGAIGNIDIRVRQALNMDGFASITGFNAASATSAPGTIAIQAGSLNLKQASLIATDSSSAGNAGGIDIRVAGKLTIDGTNPAVCLAADNCLATGIASGPAALSFEAGATGRGGDISVHAVDLAILGGGTISAVTFAVGDVGDLTVEVSGALRIDAMGGVSPVVYGTNAPADAGPVFADISSSTFWAGNAGRVSVSADAVDLAGGGNITTSSFFEATGGAGDIQVTALATMTLTDSGSYIQSQTLGGGSAGNLAVRAGTLTILKDGAITSDTSTNADAGSILVQVDGALTIDGTGHAGFVTGITSDSIGEIGTTGNAGRVAVEAGSLTLRNNAAISSNTNSAGNAGAVTVDVAGALLIDGTVRTLDTDYTAISSVANNDSGDPMLASRAGSVSVHAGSLTLLANGQILADTYTNGDAGSITVDVDGALVIDGSGQSVVTGIVSDTFVGDGKAGDVAISAASASLGQSSKIATETGAAGDGGAIAVSFGSLNMDTGAEISSTSFDTGDAGSVLVQSPGVIALDGAATTIESRALGSGEAGPVTVAADQLILSHGASVTTEAAIGGGGDIALHVNYLLYLLDSSITTTVAGGSGSGGDVFIDPQFVVLNNSQILAQAFAGNGGNITIVAGQFLQSSDSLVDASSTLGISGQILISAPETDVTSGTVQLPTGLGAVARLDQRACVGPGEAPTLSLVPVGRGGLAQLPDAARADAAFMLAGRDPAPAGLGALTGPESLRFAALPVLSASASNCVR